MPRNILIIKLGAIGDVLRTTALLHGLKEKYSGCRISWLTKESARDVLLNNQLIDEIVILKDDIFPVLKKKGFDLVINLDEEKDVCEIATNLKAEVIGFYLSPEGKVLPTETARKWYGMSALGEYPMNNILKKANRKTHQDLMCEILGINPSNKDEIFNLVQDEIKFGEDFAKRNSIVKGRVIVGVNTGAGGRWTYKKWPIEKTAELIDLMSSKLDAQILLLGGPEEEERNSKIKSMSKARIIDGGCKNSIRQFASLINICDLVVSSDSLAMHIAIALKKHVVVFFGPTSMPEIEIYGRGKKIEAPIECVCCYLTKCRKSPTCMDLLSVDMMFNAVKDVVCNIDKHK